MRIILSILILCHVITTSGQAGAAYTLSPEEAVSLALENHPLLINQSLKEAHERASLRSSWDFDPAVVTYRSGELYGPERDRYLSFNQDFGSLMKHVSAYRLAARQVKLGQTEQEIRRKEIVAEVRSAYYFWVYQQNRLALLERQMELYSGFYRIADLKYTRGEIDLAGKTGLANEAALAAVKAGMARDELEMAANQIRQLTALNREIVPSMTGLALYRTEMSADTIRYSDQLMGTYYDELSGLHSLEVASRSAEFFPELSLGFIRQDIDQLTGLWAWQVGLAFPLWFPSRLAALKQARIEAEMAETEFDYQLQKINMTIENLTLELDRTFREIVYYDRYALVQADMLSEKARLEYENEEIQFVEYARQMDRSSSVMLEYLDTMNRYNQTAIQLEFYVP